MGKKEEYRFTIQFSPTDPRHKPVVEILNSQGRRKAQYLVNAVLSYENAMEKAISGQMSPIDRETVAAIIDQILAQKTGQYIQKDKSSCLRPKENEIRTEKITFENTVSEIGEESLSAIAYSIAAFRKNG